MKSKVYFFYLDSFLQHISVKNVITNSPFEKIVFCHPHTSTIDTISETQDFLQTIRYLVFL